MTSLADAMRAAIRIAEQRGTSRYRIAQDSGVDYAVVCRFCNGERDLRLETASRLCESLGLELRSTARKRGKKHG